MSLEHLGAGRCGSIYALTPTTVMKTLNTSRRDTSYNLSELQNDATVHQIVLTAFTSSPSHIRNSLSIPTYHSWVSPTTSPSPLPESFPPHLQHVLVSQRIPSVSTNIRETLLTTFYPSAGLSAAKKDSTNEHCLMRPYFGRAVGESYSKSRSLSLRNFPLAVDMMDKLAGLPDGKALCLHPDWMVRVMADALAVMHWKANVDGNDVEFVLGGCVEEDSEKGAAEPGRLAEGGKQEEDPLRKFGLRMWLLDFNQCKTFDPDGDKEKWMQQLVNGFFYNDPYYPSPVGKEVGMAMAWMVFRERYLATARELLGHGEEGMAEDFVRAVEAEGQKRREKVKSGGGFESLLGALLG